MSHKNRMNDFNSAFHSPIQYFTGKFSFFTGQFGFLHAKSAFYWPIRPFTCQFSILLASSPFYSPIQYFNRPTSHKGSNFHWNKTDGTNVIIVMFLQTSRIGDWVISGTLYSDVFGLVICVDEDSGSYWKMTQK